jgi:hypothetical protein
LPGYSDSELRKLVADLAKFDPVLTSRMKAAFAQMTFSYGTSGKGGGTAKLAGIMADSIRKGVELRHRGPDGSPQGTTQAFGSQGGGPVHKIFQAGPRQKVQRTNNHQMMDMYYGDEGDGGNLKDRANPDILAFVMYATKLKFLPGWEKYNTWSVQPDPDGVHPNPVLKAMGMAKGWEVSPITTAMYGMDDFNQLPMSATKEISRIIRWGVQEYGGTIIFDGAEVYYDQVFSRRGRLADTDLEARVLFKYFTPGQARARFGRGTIEFHWHGKLTVPSKLLFLTSWQFNSFAQEQWYKLLHPENSADPLTGLRDTRFTAPQLQPLNPARPWEGNVRPSIQAGTKTSTAGSHVYVRGAGQPGNYQFRRKIIQEKDINEFASKKAQIELLDLWNKFATFPQGVTPWTVDSWLHSMA